MDGGRMRDGEQLHGYGECGDDGDCDLHFERAFGLCGGGIGFRFGDGNEQSGGDQQLQQQL
jgi:hypothetical protein